MAQMLREWGKHCFEITTAFNLYDLGPRSLQSSCPRPMCGGTLRKANAGTSWLKIVPHWATYSCLWPLPLFHKFPFSIPDMATNLFSASLPTYLLCIKCSISTNFGFLCGMLPLSLSSPPLTVALRQDHPLQTQTLGQILQPSQGAFFWVVSQHQGTRISEPSMGAYQAPLV